MKKRKRILAGIGAALLLLLYTSTIVLALINHPWATNMLSAAIYATIVVPVLLYAYTLIYKLLKK